ncbi:MAG TPA: hypothetical protein VFY24_10050 [Azospira sp.]|nr:hypothetical protein [Azospira sp.]
MSRVLPAQTRAATGAAAPERALPGRRGAVDLGIGLAGGIDRDGHRAAELLAAGFDSVEFGSVAAGIAGHPDASAATLAARLAAHRSPAPGAVDAARLGVGAGVGMHADAGIDVAADAGREVVIGVGIGRPSGAPLAALADCWLAGLEAVAGVADYVSFNLSAAANRPLLAAEWQVLLARSFAAVAAWRDAHAAAGGRRLRLAAKFPLGTVGEALSGVGLLAADAGFDRLTAVRADDAPDFFRLAALARHVAQGPLLVAVGGIRHAADVNRARAAGAAGVQVHRLFAEQGAACVARLRSDGGEKDGKGEKGEKGE